MCRSFNPKTDAKGINFRDTTNTEIEENTAMQIEDKYCDASFINITEVGKTFFMYKVQHVKHLLGQEPVLSFPALVVHNNVAHHVLALTESLGTCGTGVGLFL